VAGSIETGGEPSTAGDVAALWRVLSHRPQTGPWNMALDEAVAQAVAQRSVAPTLRFYAWSRPTVSVGCLQPARDAVERTVCARRSVGIVRRPTGGRAVLHDAELTYCACVPSDGVWGRLSVEESFRRFSEALVAGLRRLGVVAALGPADSGRRTSDQGGACFQMPRMPAVLVSGRKLIGSAQRRWNGVILQHGSLLLDLDLEMHQAVFPSWPRDEPDRGVTCLRSLVGVVPERRHIERALLAGWTEGLGVFGVPGTLTRREREEAERLVTTRYGTPAWTWRR
jgi:lipoate-protein ligase A